MVRSDLLSFRVRRTMKLLCLRVVTLLFLFVLVLGAFGRSALAQFEGDRPPPIVLKVPLVRQDTFVWCWLANAEMIVRYFRGRSPSQCQMMEIGYRTLPGACCGNPRACMRGGTGMQELQQVIRYFGGVATTWTPPSDPMTLYNVLAQNQAVVAQVKVSDLGTHVVVIRGMRFQQINGFDPLGRPVRSVVPLVLVNDPMSLLPQEVPYGRLLQVWIDSLIVEPSSDTTGSGGDTSHSDVAGATSPAPRTEERDSCTAVRRIVHSAPTFERVKGERRGTGGADAYHALFDIPGTRNCTVWRISSGSYFRCEVPDHEGSSCAEGERFARELTARVKQCNSSWKAREGERDRRTRYFEKIRPPDADLSITISVNESGGACRASISIDPD